MMILLLLVAFLLELVAFVSFAFSALFLPVANSFQILAGILLFVFLIIFWSLFMAPKAPRKFTLVPYYISKTIIYVISAMVLFTHLNTVCGILFIIAAVLDEVFLYKHNTAGKIKFDKDI